MQRRGMVIGVNPDQIATCKRLHEAVWPEVLDLISRCHIHNDTIFLREPETLLFGTWEYHGTAFEADMARMAADAKNQDWWTLTIPCQRPFESRAEGAWWAMMEEVFPLRLSGRPHPSPRASAA